MIRLMPLVVGLLACALVCVPVSVCAEDPPKKLTEEERKELEAKWKELNATGIKAYQTGKYPEAIKVFENALRVARQLYNKAEFPDGHENLALSLNNLAALYKGQRMLSDAEPVYKESLEIYKRLFKNQDHPYLAGSLNNLAFLYQAQGKLSDAEDLLKDGLEMRKRLFKNQGHPDLATSLNNLALLYKEQGKLSDAEPLLKNALEMRKRLFKNQDHPDLATSLNNLAALHQDQGKLTDSESLFKESLEMRKRLFKDKDHPDLAGSLNNLAVLYQDQRKLSDAEPLLKDALDMNKRLFKNQDHPSVAQSLHNLAVLARDQGKLSEAETLSNAALEMHRRLFKNQEHPDLGTSLNNLASLYLVQGKLADAELLYKDALEMRKRLFKDKDHPDLATSLNNLALLYKEQGKLSDAELLYKDALKMREHLFKYKDHPDVAGSLNNLASLYLVQGKLADAELLYKDALEMTKRLLVEYAKQKSEGDVLTMASAEQLTLDALMSVARLRFARTPDYDPAAVYPALWTKKGMVARVYEQRQLQSRAATDPVLAKMLAQLTDARRRRAELILAPATKDPGTLKKREDDLAALDKIIADFNLKLPKLLPPLARIEKLDKATVDDLQKALPADAAMVDYIRYTFFEWDNDKPPGKKETRTERYLAFVVTREKVTWVDLDTAKVIEPAVLAWREAITSGKDIAPAVPAKVRELVWEKVRKALPANIKTLYVCPDAILCKVPFAALPGDKANTILLEDFALASIPHAPFLLDQLWKQDEIKNPPTQALVVGGVTYEADVTGTAKTPDPLVKPGTKLGWSFLGNTVGEANGVSDTATRKKLPLTRIEGEKATTTAILAALPKAKYAHFATHGFFSDESFRGVFQLTEEDYKQEAWGERRGRAINSPLLMTGLVFAGANNPKTPARGILTGEQLIDLDLSGLELAVLSACETGLGDVAGGEGVFGLQRAFHYAGTRNVVASLWKVPDAPTAALMNLFYQNLWDKNLSPLESLRQAQLELYKNPGRIPELAKGFRGKFEEVPTMGVVDVKPGKDGKAYPLLWAAFTLSGSGR